MWYYICIVSEKRLVRYKQQVYFKEEFIMTNDNKKYEAPEILSEVTVCEPVETGCCLRSCGGSPSRMQSEALVSEETKARFEDIIHNEG